MTGITAWVTARILPPEPLVSLDAYVSAGGGRGLGAARRLGPAGTLEHLDAAGLRGRGGGGFPTGRKWRSVQAYASTDLAATVVVNAAEGEPGTFKDRALVRANPFSVLEGALIAALAVDADQVIVATKRTFASERQTLCDAVDAIHAAGWNDGIQLTVFAGPSEYLYGEETGLLEVLDGRPPLPRIAPPFRHGVEEVIGDVDRDPVTPMMSGAEGDSPAPPTLVNNVETLANVPGILAEGPAWFREVGTDQSPGPVLCTVSGCTRQAGVGEIAMGTPLRAVIEEVGGGPAPGRRIRAVMSGVANPLLPADRLDTPVSFEAMEAAGSGLGAAGFIVFDDATDMVAMAQAVSRFLAVESCGQCSPCKEDGLALATILERVRQSDARDRDLVAIDDRLRTITDSARCFLAHQHQRVVGSVATTFDEDLRAHVEAKVEPAEPMLIAPIVDIVDGVATLDETQTTKQPDWTHDRVDSGQWPAARLSDDPDAAPVVPSVHVAGGPPPTNTSVDAPSTEAGAASPPPVRGVPVESLDPDDPEAALYSSVPLDTEDGPVVIQQQSVGPDNEQGGGEWPDPDTPPRPPAPETP